jgi:hypothetical protein
MSAMTDLKQVIKAHEAITAAEERYREKLRAALDAGVPQIEISKALGVTREKVRQDAMTDEERERLRRADAERKADLRQRARGSAPMAESK